MQKWLSIIGIGEDGLAGLSPISLAFLNKAKIIFGGAGCGSISIEWLRSDRRCRAIAIEQNSTRINYIADNAAALGTQNLQIMAGKALEVIPNLPAPNAIFLSD